MPSAFGPFGLGARLKRSKAKVSDPLTPPDVWVRNVNAGWLAHMSALDPNAPIALWRRTTYYVLPLIKPGDFVAFVKEGLVVGVGGFDYSLSLTVGDAWQDYGLGLGLTNYRDFLEKCGTKDLRDATKRGAIVTCRVIRNTCWFDPSTSLLFRTLPQAERGRPLCSTSSELGRLIVSQWQSHTLKGRGFEDSGWLWQETMAPKNTWRSRPGQKQFQSRIFVNYGRCCVVSGQSAAPALNAAHIHAFARSGNHDVTNGLLLRADLHGLFDDGYWTIDHGNRVQLSADFVEDFPDSDYSTEFGGRELTALYDAPAAPCQTALNWHRTEIYLG